MWNTIFKELGKYLLRAYGSEVYNIVKTVKSTKKLRKYKWYAKWLKATKNNHYKLFKSRLTKKYINLIIKRVGIRTLKTLPLGRDIHEIASRGYVFYFRKLLYTQLVPTEIRKIIYYLKLLRSLKEKSRTKRSKTETQKILNGYNGDLQSITEQFYSKNGSENLRTLTKLKPNDPQEKALINAILSAWISFMVKSPERHCFDKVPQIINIKKKTCLITIQGELFDKPLKTYIYKFNTTNQASKYYNNAINTDNYGRKVFVQIRPKLKPYVRRALYDLYHSGG